jgi:hypothetical protein
VGPGLRRLDRQRPHAYGATFTADVDYVPYDGSLVRGRNAPVETHGTLFRGVLAAVGVVVASRGRLVLALGLTIEDDKITLIDVIADPERLHELDLAILVD